MSAQRVSQRSRVRLRCVETLEAQSFERRLLRIADASFDLPFAIGIADTAREGDHPVMREYIAIDWIQRGVVDVRSEDAFFQIVEDDDADGAAQPAKSVFVELGPDLRARAPHEQPHRLARAAQGQDEEPRTAVLPRAPVADHRAAVAVVDLAFFAGRGRDDDARLGGRRAAQFQDEAPDTRVPRGEAVIVDEVLPDRDRVPPVPQCLDNQLAIRFARAGTRRTRGRRARRVGGHRLTNGWIRQRGVGGHLDGNGRFCRPFAWPPASAHRDPSGQQIATSRRAVHTRRLRDPPHRPPQAAESKNLLLLLVIQNVAHPGEGPCAPRLRQRLGAVS